jgi:hypothetical protein
MEAVCFSELLVNFHIIGITFQEISTLQNSYVREIFIAFKNLVFVCEREETQSILGGYFESLNMEAVFPLKLLPDYRNHIPDDSTPQDDHIREMFTEFVNFN